MIDLSFIIPMYNAEKYIEKCIDSILHQGLDEGTFEIIVIDDGSTDNGRELVQKYSEVNYFYQQNQGQSVARNNGIEKAQGEYICFVDADDYYIHNTLRQCVESAKSYDVDLLTFGMVECDKNEKYLQPVYSSNEIQTWTNGVKYLEDNNYNNGPWWYLIKRSALYDTRFIPGHYGEDGMFTMELLMKIGKIARIDRTCYCYIQRPSSTTTRRDQAHLKKMVDDYLFVYNYMQNLIAENKSILSERSIDRCVKRSQTYIFFMMIRVMRFSTSSKQIDDVIYSLRKNNVKNVICPSKIDYPGHKYPIITFILNHRILLKTANKLLQIIK